jgi:hypothetical protein
MYQKLYFKKSQKLINSSWRGSLKNIKYVLIASDS